MSNVDTLQAFPKFRSPSEARRIVRKMARLKRQAAKQGEAFTQKVELRFYKAFERPKNGWFAFRTNVVEETKAVRRIQNILDGHFRRKHLRVKELKVSHDSVHISTGSYLILRAAFTVV